MGKTASSMHTYTLHYSRAFVPRISAKTAALFIVPTVLQQRGIKNFLKKFFVSEPQRNLNLQQHSRKA